jgi:hypothetical protein
VATRYQGVVTPEPKSVEKRSASTVVSDIFLSYHEINTLPKKVAVLYVLYQLLNVSFSRGYWAENLRKEYGLIGDKQWFIYRTQSTYDQMPRWLRPMPAQLNTPHPSWIDRIP